MHELPPLQERLSPSWRSYISICAPRANGVAKNAENPKKLWMSDRSQAHPRPAANTQPSRPQNAQRVALAELDQEGFQFPVALSGQQLVGIAPQPLEVELTLLGHEHRLDVAYVFGAVKDLLEHHKVLGRVNGNLSPLQVAQRTPLQDLVMKGMPAEEELRADSLAHESRQVGLAAKVLQDGRQLHGIGVRPEVLTARTRQLVDEPRKLCVRNEREHIHILCQPGRAIVVIGDGATVGALQLETI